MCHIWITIGTDGVKSDQTKIRYTSMEFVDMAVFHFSMFLQGIFLKTSMFFVLGGLYMDLMFLIPERFLDVRTFRK